MNTPTHILIALLVTDKASKHSLAQQHRTSATLAATLGALLPDITMFIFYAWEKFNNVPEATIWQVDYYADFWQPFFNIPNSIPMFATLLVFGLWLRSPITIWLAVAALLHLLLDLLLHHDDAHQHFWPISTWTWQSPLSYWDPEHGGDWFRWFEIIFAVGLASMLLWRYGWLQPIRKIIPKFAADTETGKNPLNLNKTETKTRPLFWARWLVLALMLIYFLYVTALLVMLAS